MPELPVDPRKKKDGEDEEVVREPQDVNLKHNFNYVGGTFAYKNKKKIKRPISEDNCWSMPTTVQPVLRFLRFDLRALLLAGRRP